MKRYIGVIEEIDWKTNSCRVRIPSKDGIGILATTDIGFAIMNQLLTQTKQLQIGKIPFTLRGLRVKDIVLVIDSEDINDDYAVIGFYGGTYEE